MRQSVPLSHDSSNETLNGRIASVNLILNDTPAQRRRSPDRGNESNLLNIASDDDKRHGYGMQDFVDFEETGRILKFNILKYRLLIMKRTITILSIIRLLKVIFDKMK